MTQPSPRHLEAVRSVLVALENGTRHEPDRLRRLALALVLLEDVTYPIKMAMSLGQSLEDARRVVDELIAERGRDA